MTSVHDFLLERVLRDHFLVDFDAEARPVGSTISVVPIAPAGGATTRSFTVKQAGLGTNSFVLTITVISFK